MDPRHYRTGVACASVVLFFFAARAPAQEPAAESPSLPVVTFFYYDAAGVEWAFSAEPERFRRHLASNSDSQALFDGVTAAVAEKPDAAGPARQMTRWIESERERFEQTRREPARMRMAEGIIAYLRDHDFSISKLVDDLKHRSGASEVELVIIHLRDGQGSPSYKLQVVLVDPEIAISKQGFNVNLPEPKATYTVVTYALGVALYEVQEIIHRDSSKEDTQENKNIEPLPLPDPLETPATDAVPALLRSPA
ncbi:MAG: hypothetical protein WD063_11295 [Pirellulales bacterium]